MFLQIPPTLEATQLPRIGWGPDLSPLLAQISSGNFENIPIIRDIDFSSLIVALKTVSFILTVIFITVIVVIMLKARKLIQKKVSEKIMASDLTPPAEARSPYDARWQEIRSHVVSFKESDWKLAVIEADKLADDALKAAGYPGETMGERLMMIKPGQLVNIQFLWDAHKLRNLLVHDANYQLTHKQAIWSIDAFESALKELGALS